MDPAKRKRFARNPLRSADLYGLPALVSLECPYRRPAENPGDTLPVLPQYRQICHRFFPCDCFAPARGCTGSPSRSQEHISKGVAELHHNLSCAGSATLSLTAKVTCAILHTINITQLLRSLLLTPDQCIIEPY